LCGTVHASSVVRASVGLAALAAIMSFATTLIYAGFLLRLVALEGFREKKYVAYLSGACALVGLIAVIVMGAGYIPAVRADKHCDHQPELKCGLFFDHVTLSGGVKVTQGAGPGWFLALVASIFCISGVGAGIMVSRRTGSEADALIRH